MDLVAKSKYSEVENQFILDEATDSYVWLRFGWTESGRLESITVFVRLFNDKIYIEEDLTEKGIAADLMEKGISPKDIVLAFQKPEKRKLTEFALN
jgi:hypothetical protein